MVVSGIRLTYHMPKGLTYDALNYSDFQARFYDVNPPLTPWPEILIERGLTLLYKPREIFLKKEIDKLRLKSGDKLLEVGCGQGVFLKRIVKTYGVDAVGVDVSEKSIKYARQNQKGRLVEFVVGDALNLPFQNDSFSVVISFDLLEHIADQEKAVEEMTRVLKPEGLLIIYSLNKRYKYTLDWLREALGFDIFSRAAHKKDLLIDTEFLKRELQEKGMKIADFKLFDAFFVLALDEFIMAMAFVMGKLGLFKKRSLGLIFLGISSFISHFLYPALYLLDYFWLRKNYSLSFIIVCKKYAK